MSGFTAAQPLDAGSENSGHGHGQQELTQLIELALDNDASRKQIYSQSRALRETAISSSSLKDPKLKVGFGGLPVDSFAFDEDPMTNISIGYMQEFERGSTLSLKQKQINQQSRGMEFQIKARELEIANQVTQLWLELGYQQQAAQNLRKKVQLMSEMEKSVQSSYATGKSEAQNLLQAQLMTAKLEEKLQANSQIQQRILSQLSEWLGEEWLSVNQKLQATYQLDWERLNQTLSHSQGTKHYEQLTLHPTVKMADITISTSKTQVELANESYTPKFGVEVMYAYRQADNMMGEPASDLVSAYLTMDIPLFTGNRQDRSQEAAQYQVGAAKFGKDQLLSKMNARVNALLVDKANLEQRLERYQSVLTSQAKARTAAVQRSYQGNTASFNEVINAANDELSIELEQFRLTTDLNIVCSNLAYMLNSFEYQIEVPDIRTTVHTKETEEHK